MVVLLLEGDPQRDGAVALAGVGAVEVPARGEVCGDPVGHGPAVVHQRVVEVEQDQPEGHRPARRTSPTAS